MASIHHATATVMSSHPLPFSSPPFRSVSRKEGMLVLLEGRSEFDARDVTFTGSHTFVVPDGARMTVLPDAASPEGFKVQVERLAGDEPSWVWEYALGADGAVTLTMRERGEQAGEREATLVARERA